MGHRSRPRGGGDDRARGPAEGSIGRRRRGTCDRGAKKLLYTQTTLAGPATAPRNLPARAEKKTDTIITECKDGSEPVRGECRK